MPIVLQTAPQREPVTLEEVKTHLRVETDDHDGALTQLIPAARQYVETITGRAFITQTWKLYADRFLYEFRIPRPPLQSVTGVQYKDASEALQTLAASNYVVDTASEPARLHQNSNGTYPNTSNNLNAVTITFVAGYGDEAEDVPGPLRRAILLHIERLFDTPSGPYADSIEWAFDSLIAPYRIDGLAL